MSLAALIGFLLLTGMAAYVQTLTGFAFGLIAMGGVGLTGLLSLPDAAMLISALTLVNATQMLLKGWRDVDWRKFGLVLIASWPFVFIGFSTVRHPRQSAVILIARFESFAYFGNE